MKKVNKGSVGYFAYKKRLSMLIMIFGLFMVLLMFYTGIIIYADKKNMFTVFAAVSMLPAAKYTINFLMYPKKGKATKEEFDRIKMVSQNMIVYADILVTPEKKNIEFPYVAIGLNHIVIYCEDKKLDQKYHGDFISKFLMVEGYQSNISFYTDFDKYVNRIKNIAVNEPENYSDEELDRIYAIARKIIILSI